MSKQPAVDQELITRKIKTSLKTIDTMINKKKKTNTRLVITGMSTSAASTLVAGVTSAAGPVIGSGIEGWRLACIAAAVLSLVATVSAGINQQLESSNRLNEAEDCLSRLRLLDMNILTGNKNWEEIGREYRELSSLYPRLIR